MSQDIGNSWRVTLGDVEGPRDHPVRRDRRTLTVPSNCTLRRIKELGLKADDPLPNRRRHRVRTPIAPTQNITNKGFR